jgi:putative hydroxymethylpyrimidine transport system substrate-binding protein
MRLTRALAFASALVASAVGVSLPSQAEETHMTVLLDWFVNPDHGPLIVAKELGYFKEAGLDVELVAPADPNDPPKLVAAGKAEIAIGYQPQLHVQVAEGLPLVRFGTLVATPLNSLVALKDGPIKELKDLKGKKVGYSVGGFEDALLGAMLNSEGLSLDDVELVNVNFSLSPAVISGQVDAVIGAFRNFELNQMDIADHPGVAFYPEEHGVPVYDELIFITAADKRDDPRLAAFLAAVERATHYIVNHPEKSWDIFRSHSPDVDDELNKRAWFATIPRFDMTPAALDSGRYARFAGFLKAQGLIKETVPVSTYALAVGQE